MADKLNNIIVTGKIISKIARGKQYEKLLGESETPLEPKLPNNLDGLNTNPMFTYTTDKSGKTLIVEMKPEYSVLPIRISKYDAAIAVKVSEDEEDFIIFDH